MFGRNDKLRNEGFYYSFEITSIIKNFISNVMGITRNANGNAGSASSLDRVALPCS